VDFVHAADAPPAEPPVVQDAQFVPGGIGQGRFRRGRRVLGDPYARARRLAPGGLEGRLRAVIPLVMATPEYQVC
jgi:hypothetical protein